MIIEVGKRYVRRDGSLSGVIVKNINYLTKSIYEFYDGYETYSKKGEFQIGDDSQFDLISEYTEQSDFKTITDSIASLLEYKNDKYGNAIAEPVNIFSGKCKAGNRLDDKLSRVKNSNELRKNDIADLLGYLTHICVEKGWTNFDEFKD